MCDIPREIQPALVDRHSYSRSEFNIGQTEFGGVKASEAKQQLRAIWADWATRCNARRRNGGKDVAGAEHPLTTLMNDQYDGRSLRCATQMISAAILGIAVHHHRER